MKIIGGLSIPRHYVNLGILTRNATFAKSSIATMTLYREELDELPFFESKFNRGPEFQQNRAILFADRDGLGFDLSNGGLQYPVMNITPDHNLKALQNEYGGFAIANNYSLEDLLEYLGFGHNLSLADLKKLRAILINRKELKKLAIPFGYRKINISKTNRLDWEQKPHMGSEYYKFLSGEIPSHEKCIFDKEVPPVIEAQIGPVDLFKLLLEAESIGYGVPSKEERAVAKVHRR